MSQNWNELVTLYLGWTFAAGVILFNRIFSIQIKAETLGKHLQKVDYWDETGSTNVFYCVYFFLCIFWIFFLPCCFNWSGLNKSVQMIIDQKSGAEHTCRPMILFRLCTYAYTHPYITAVNTMVQNNGTLRYKIDFNRFFSL